MTERMEVSEATVRALADLAGLSLEEGREALIAPQLAEWLAGANELSRKMAEPEHQEVTPITVFVHPNVREDAE